MNADNPFEQSLKRQDDITKQKQEHRKQQVDDQQQQQQQIETNATAIDRKLRRVLEHLAPKIKQAKDAGYGVSHQFGLSAILPKGSSQCYGKLALYMRKGGVIESLSPSYPPEADYVLTFTGIAPTGTISAHYFSKISGANETMRSFASVDELSDSAVDATWDTFAERSLATEEQRLRGS